MLPGGLGALSLDKALALPEALPSLLPRTPTAPGGSFSVSGSELSREQDKPHPAEGLDLGFMAQQHFISFFLPCSQVDKIESPALHTKRCFQGVGVVQGHTELGLEPSPGAPAPQPLAHPACHERGQVLRWHLLRRWAWLCGC